MKTLVTIIVVLAVIGGGYFLLRKPAQAPMSNETASTGSENASPNVDTTGTKANGTTYTVIYTDNGYSPKELTIKRGDTVVWKNESSQNMWTASAQHPAHTVYSGTNLNEHCPDTAGTAFDQCGDGDTYTFTFEKTGIWGYHNHSKASDFGKITVQ